MQSDSIEPQTNQLILHPEGYVEAIFVGVQTENSFRHIYEEVLPIIEDLKAKHKPLLGLIDMTRQTGYTLESDKAALNLLEALEYDRLALCNAPHAEVVKGILLALDRHNKTKFFKSRDEALSWLLNTEPN